MTRLIPILIFALLTSFVIAQTEKNKQCRPSFFVKIEECCSMPRVATKASYIKCNGNITRGANKLADGFLQSYRSYNGLRGGGPGGPACLIECVMEAQGLLNSNGELDQSKLNAQWKQNADASWSSLLDEATKYCSAKVAKVDLSAVDKPRNGEKVCKISSALYVTCVKRELALRCPANKKTNNPDLKEICDKKMEQLKTCNMFETMSRQGKQEIAMFRAVRTRKSQRKLDKSMKKSATNMRKQSAALRNKATTSNPIKTRNKESQKQG